MAQHDYVIANGTGAAVRSDLNNALAAIVSQNSGATAPSPTYAFQFWADTTAGVLKLRNSANSAWITLFQLDGEWTTLPVENGTAAAPSIYFKDSGTDTGFYSPGTDQVAISTGGTGRLFINSSGSVGIGTSSPADALHVVGKIAVTGTNPSIRQTVQTANLDLCGGTTVGTDSCIQLYGSSSPSDANHTFYNSNVHIWRNAAGTTQYGRFDSSGRLGIGTTSPGYLVTAATSADGVDGVSVESPSVNGVIRLRADGTNGNAIRVGGVGAQGNTLRFLVGSDVERARIDSSGRLLVGTSSYSGNGKLVTAGNTGGNAGTFDICWAGSRPTAADTDIGYIRWFSADNSSSNAHYAAIYASSDGASSSGSDIPGRLVFSTTKDGQSSPTEACRIDSSQNLLIGTTLSNLGGTTSTGINLIAGGTIRGSASDTAPLLLNRLTSNGEIQYFQRQGSTVGSITVTTSATAYNTSSDYRLKENVTAVTDGITRLQQLKPSRFTFIADPSKTVDGFIAHEVQAVVPEAIHGTKDAVDDDGNPIYQGIDQSKLVPLLTAALQEAIAKIETLEARLTALESA